MVVILSLLVLGVVLIGLEIFLPGGILGVLGFAALIGASLLTYQDYGLLPAVGVGMLGVVASFFAIFLEITLLPKTRFGNKLLLKKEVEGRSKYQASGSALDGARGETVTKFAPTGMVKVQGKVYEGYSMDGLLDKGIEVEVVGQDNFRLLLKKVPEPEEE